MTDLWGIAGIIVLCFVNIVAIVVSYASLKTQVRVNVGSLAENKKALESLLAHYSSISVNLARVEEHLKYSNGDLGGQSKQINELQKLIAVLTERIKVVETKLNGIPKRS